MTALKSILVDEDPIATHHPALEQVVRLARRCDARMKIVDVLHGGRGAGRFPRPLQAVMGNTAERVLQRLRGSVFAVKPPGFSSSLVHPS